MSTRKQSVGDLLIFGVVAIAALVVAGIFQSMFLDGLPMAAQLWILVGSVLLLVWGYLRDRLVRWVTVLVWIVSVACISIGTVLALIAPHSDVLVPSNEPIPSWVPACFPDEPKVIIGRNIIAASEGSFLLFGGTSSNVTLSVSDEGNLSLNATILDPDSDVIAAKIQQGVPEDSSLITTMILSDDQHHVRFVDRRSGDLVLYVHFLNRNTIHVVRGTFTTALGLPEITVGVDSVSFGDQIDEEPRCLLVRGPIWIALHVTEDGIAWP